MGIDLKNSTPVVEGSEGIERADSFSLSSAIPVSSYEEAQNLTKPKDITFFEMAGSLIKNAFKGQVFPEELQTKVDAYEENWSKRFEEHPEELKIAKALLLPSWEALQSVKSATVSYLNKEDMPDNPLALKDRSIREVPMINDFLTSPSYVKSVKNAMKAGAMFSFANPTTPLFFMPDTAKQSLLGAIDLITPEVVASLTETSGDILALGAIEGSMALLRRFEASKVTATKAPSIYIEGKGYNPEEITSINKVQSAVEDVIKQGSDNPFSDVVKQRKTYSISPQELNLWKGAASSEPVIMYGAGLPVSPEKERGFVTSVKEALPVLKVAGQYIPRSTDILAQQTRTLIKDDLQVAEKMAAEGTDDASVAVGTELLKYYVNEAENAPALAKDAIYQKATDLANSMAVRLTELGRSVQAASILSRLTPEGQVRFATRTIQKYNQNLKDLNKRIPELTPQQTQDIITRMKEIQTMPEGEEKAVKFDELQDYISNLVPTPLMDKIVTVWKAGLLTGLKTSGVNVLANAFHGATETLKDIPATLVDMATSALTGERTVSIVTKGEMKGLAEGAKKGWRFLKTSYDERNVLSKYDYKKVNIGKGKIAQGIQTYEEFIFRILGAEDQPFYYGAKMRSLYEQAKVQAINKGVKGKEAESFIDNLVMNPTEGMTLNAVNDAKIAVFQNETALGRMAKAIQKLPGHIGEFLLPFGKTPSAVATQIINYTPVGGASTILKNIKNFNQREFAKGLGRAITGTSVLGLGYWLYKQGQISLDRPTSEAQQKLWEVEGRSPNTIKVGGAWRQVQSLGPLGNVILIGAHFAKAFEETGSITGALAQGASGSIKSFTEQTFLKGVNSALEAVSDPQRSAASFINSFVGSSIPTIVKDVAMATDTKVRRPEGPMQAIMDRMPILRYMLEPKVDVFGKDIERTNNLLETMADPTRPSKIKNDPVVNELRRLSDVKQELHTSQLGKKTGYESLTQKENTKLWRQAGQMAYEQISQLMQYDAYNAMPDDRKAQRINKIIDKTKETAKLSVIMEATANLNEDQLITRLSAMKKEGLLTEDLFKKLMRLR